MRTPWPANQTAASRQGRGGAGRALVGDLGDVGEPGGVVDDDLEVVVADGARRVARPPSVAAEHPVPAAVGDPAELLVVLVDELARVLADVADRDAR